jgi:hypothetical protein
LSAFNTASEPTSDAHKMLAKYHAVGGDGMSVLTVVGTDESVMVEKFAIGDAQIMADESVVRGQAANAYFGPAVMRRDLAHGKRGSIKDVVAVPGLVIDADADTGKDVVLPPGIEHVHRYDVPRTGDQQAHPFRVYTRAIAAGRQEARRAVAPKMRRRPRH